MFGMFKALATRIQALFLTNAALDIEANFLSRTAERKAQLLNEADQYEKDGKLDLAKQIRERIPAMDYSRPLAVILPSVEHLKSNGEQGNQLPKPESVENKQLTKPQPESSTPEEKPNPKPRKKPKARKK